MAYDLLLKKRKRNWSRDGLSGDPACTRAIVVQEQRPRPGLLGWSLGIMIGSRLVTGRWPWYWAKKIDQKLG